jgi:cytochrome c-type biogenesis protein CcmH
VKKLFILLCLLMIYQHSIASEDYYTFNSHDKQQRFESLLSQLRCLVCQNQTLADSNAPLAEDLRNQVYLKINAGQSDKNITDYLISRYGNFILYRPPFDKATLVLWCGPFIIFLFSMIYLFYCIRNKNKSN